MHKLRCQVRRQDVQGYQELQVRKRCLHLPQASHQVPRSTAKDSLHCREAVYKGNPTQGQDPREELQQQVDFC